MYGIENEAVFNAMTVFEETEGIDIVPASGVAVAALFNAAENGFIRKSDTILLNITGGGEKRLKQERDVYSVEPHIISKKITDKEIESLLCDILKMNS